MNRIAKVAVDLSLDREFDYLIPEALAAAVEIGSRVEVPFGRRKVTGFVVGLADTSSISELKAIGKVLSEKSLISETVMELARWMSAYYLAPFETCVRAVLPAIVRRKAKGEKKQLTVSLNVDEAGSPVSSQSCSVVGQASLYSESLCLLRHQESTRSRIREACPTMEMRHFTNDMSIVYEGLTEKQRTIIQCLEKSGPMLLAELTAAAGVTASPVRTLEKKGLVTVSAESVYRDPHAGIDILKTGPMELMPQQQQALKQILDAMSEPEPPVVLLHGVTGSGKTEVYLQAIARAVEQGQGAVVLVPEIVLTPQTVDQFRARFADRPGQVAVLHSSLSDGERYDEWHRIRSGEAQIVVGARSALFAPVHNLGLIVVDEEHEPTYKQDETPRYHARDMAVLRGRLERCAVVLGSATPSLESVANANSGKYRYAEMTIRVDDRTMPQMRIIDMRIEAQREGRPHLFSRELIEAIRSRLDRAEQTMIFLNRRGFSSSLVCPECGYTAECGQCSVGMTYHKAQARLVCHLCGDELAVPSSCPQCGSPQFKYGGAGTEKIEEVMNKLFPHAVIERMDSDSMRRKNAHRDLLGKFRVGKIDILVGTQMIAKGLDFPNVTLVGVVNPDHALHMADFRAGERVFHLLTQVAGRAGRGATPGEVIVQTYTPHHAAIQAARRMDFTGFCDQELAFRRELSYPPLTHLTCITLRGKNNAAVEKTAETLFEALEKSAGNEMLVSPAVPAPIERIRGDYRWQILLRSANVKDLNRTVRTASAKVKWPREIGVTIDVDATSLL